MTLDPNSPLHFLYGLTPDPDAVKDARAFALMLPAAPDVGGRVKDLCMCFAHFATQHAGPRLPGAHSEALNVFAFAASGLFAFLEDAQRPGLEDGWATLSTARLWAVDKCQQATADLPPSDSSAWPWPFASLDTLPTWASGQARTVEAGRLAAWGAVAYLLEAAPGLEDGEAEEMTAAVLEALAPGPRGQGAPPLAHPFPSPDPSHVPGPHTAQSVEALPGGRVRVSMGGGEDYELTRAQVALTPLPNGSGFLAVFIGTPDALTVRLTPEDCQTVRRALALDGPTLPPHDLH